MTHKAITALASKLSPHVALSKSRLETLSLLIVALVRACLEKLGRELG